MLSTFDIQIETERANFRPIVGSKSPETFVNKALLSPAVFAAVV